jgi:ssDNA-binding Zn-finger/Zn-ribbon topoisomerase 1
MFLRTARRGQRSGRKFWGCSRYPSCRGTRSY